MYVAMKFIGVVEVGHRHIRQRMRNDSTIQL